MSPESEGSAGQMARLRARAEELLSSRGGDGRDASIATDLGRVLHELEVSHAELEIQNQQLREAQAGVESARARADDLFRRAPACHLVTDEWDRIIDANDAAMLQLGDGLRGLAMQRVVARASQEDFARHRRRVFESGRRQGCELWLRRGDGSEGEFWMESVAWLDDEHHRTLLSSAIDLSARKAAERSLRESEERYRALFDHATDAILIFNSDGLLVDGNPAAARLLGWLSDGSLSVIHLAELLGQGQPAAERLLASARQPGQTPPFVELEVVRADGSKLEVEVSVAAPRGEFVQLVMRDLTQRRRAEEERLRLEERLRARRVEAVERLAGGLAHDMNNVLATIMSLSSVLTESLGAEASTVTARADAMEILAACHHGRSLTQNLLAFARQSTMTRRELDVNAVLRDAVAALSREMPATVQLFVEPTSAETRVAGDPGQVAQIVTNLCINALEAMPTGGMLRLETARLRLDGAARPPGTERLPPRDYVRIAVSDSGSGIAPEAMPYVSEPFFTTKVGRGTGLGLAIVCGCAESHDGAVHIESAPARGTRVSVYLPAIDLSSLSPVAQRPVGFASPYPHTEGRRSVLLVEDDPSVRKATRRLLERVGCSVVSVASGEEALEAHVAEGPFDLVIMDINMPGMDGINCARLLFEREPSLRVLFASGYSRERIPSELLAQPNVGALRKPFTIEELERSVEDMLAR